VLSDAKKRREYDAGGFSAASTEDLLGGVDFDELLRGAGFDLGHFDFGGGLFDRFFGRRSQGPPRGRDIDVELVIPLSLVASGGEETLQVQRPGPCKTCGGSGASPGSSPRPCPTCHGSGQEVKSRQEAGVTIQHVSICTACHGRGRIIDQPCTACAGSGRSDELERLTVRIPVGVEEGMVLRVPGHGMPAPAQGGLPGDLRVTVYSGPDQRFERAGADLWRSETLSIPQAVLGTQRQVPTLDGSADVRIPAGSQPGSVLRLRAKGLPHFGAGGHGDLLLRLQLEVPQTLDAEERKLYQRLLKLEHGAR
jgi:molecular chaperone DnaJ